MGAPVAQGCASIFATGTADPPDPPEKGSIEITQSATSRVVFIRWADAERQQTNSWESPNDYEKEFRDCVTVGFVLREEPDHVVVCGSMSVHPNGADQVLGLTVIPTSCVKEFRKIAHFSWPIEGEE